MKKNSVLILLYVGCMAVSAAMFYIAAGKGMSPARNPLLLASGEPT